MNILVFDTETTGMALWRLPYDDPRQPWLVQIGAILYDEQWNVRAELNMIVRPLIPIPPEASAIHGITDEVVRAHGLSHSTAVTAFYELTSKAAALVAHNSSFDLLVVKAACARQGLPVSEALDNATFCTMKAMTPICKLPGNYGDYKWPKLQEAHNHAFGESFEGHHDAMADVRACARLYRWLFDSKRLANAEVKP